MDRAINNGQESANNADGCFNTGELGKRLTTWIFSLRENHLRDAVLP